MYTNASCSKYTSRQLAFLNHSLTGNSNSRTKNHKAPRKVPKRTRQSHNAKPLHTKTGHTTDSRHRISEHGSQVDGPQIRDRPAG